MNIDTDTRGRQFKTFKQIESDSAKISPYMIKCSHTMLFTGKKDRLICSHCKHYVYKDKKTEIKYKVKELLK